MCYQTQTFCTPCGRWQDKMPITYCPRADPRWTPPMPCYGPNVVFLFQRDHIRTVNDGLCDRHQKVKDEMDELERMMAQSDLLGREEEARVRMTELEGLFGDVNVGDDAEGAGAGVANQGAVAGVANQGAGAGVANQGAGAGAERS